MKILLVNGSPKKAGCTYTALEEVAGALREEGMEAEIFQLGNKPLPGCIDCRKCIPSGRCIFNDAANEFRDLAEKADGFVFGSPVHYAAASGSLTSFMDRVFFPVSCNGLKTFYLKPAAGIVSARRGGTTATFDQINKYFTILQMPVISSSYWNMVHGMTPEEVRQDLEGMQVMRVLGRNMAWFLRCKEAALAAGVPFPKQEPQVMTNFMR